MATVSELIKFLEDIPPDAELQVLERYDCGYSDCVKFVPMNLDEIAGNVTFFGKAVDGRSFLDFGEE